ncbi:MAG: 4-hydroxy-tetrahydrodipicolinate reductase [Bacteroidales bacterium]|nr:4-hydroxy-tetrahydrodipicolinate reductase [Bacteroidales bacterium]
MRTTDDRDIKVIISGYGRMGHLVEEALGKRDIRPVLASEDIQGVAKDVAAECVCIDFTTPDAFKANYRTLARNFKAVVVGTTGWDDIKEEVIGFFEKCGTPMIYSSNFSIGVNAFFAAIETACRMLRDKGYAPRVNEIHHIHKMDAPSGTAKTIAGIVSEALGSVPEIESERVGEVPGTHTAEFVSDVDRLSFTHEAFSRQGFADGAVVAAMMAEGLNGVYEFRELIFG